MQIFRPYHSSYHCAKSLCDLRLNKQILESAQMLSSALHVRGIDKDLPCKPGWLNHPLTIWTTRFGDNYHWHYGFLQSCCDEYRLRKNKNHFYRRFIDYFMRHEYIFPIGKSDQPNCTKFKDLQITKAYRLHLSHKWFYDKRIPKWTNRNPPTWITESLKELKNRKLIVI